MKRAGILIIFFALIAGGYFIVDKSIDSAGSFALINQDELDIIAVPEAKWPESTWHAAEEYKNTFGERVPKKSLDGYYAHRAYYGAPPYIPHPVDDDSTIGGKACLKCHENGGYVNKYDAFAPVVPHPEKVNCRQCHAAVKTEKLFRSNSFDQQREKQPAIHQKALVSSPPVIPHPLEMREDCLSCHAGPAAKEEIRTTHPERVNCRQCHALNTQEKEIKDFVKELK